MSPKFTQNSWLKPFEFGGFTLVISRTRVLTDRWRSRISQIPAARWCQKAMGSKKHVPLSNKKNGVVSFVIRFFTKKIKGVVYLWFGNFTRFQHRFRYSLLFLKLHIWFASKWCQKDPGEAPKLVCSDWDAISSICFKCGDQRKDAAGFDSHWKT